MITRYNCGARATTLRSVRIYFSRSENNGSGRSPAAGGKCPMARSISTSSSVAESGPIKSSPYKEPFDMEDLKLGLLEFSALPTERMMDKRLGVSDEFYRNGRSGISDSRLGISIIPSFANSPNVERLGQFIASRNLNSASHTFQRLAEEEPTGCLRHFTATQCSQFLVLIPLGSVKAAQYWPLARQIASTMDLSGHSLTADDYSCLIECAFKAHDYESVEKIWTEQVQKKLHVSLQTTELWNKYIMATCNAYPKFWKQWAGMKVKRQELRLFEPDQTPLAVNDAVLLLAEMLRRNMHPNTRTYELVLLYLCQKGDLQDVRSIFWSIWNVSTNPNLVNRSRLKRRQLVKPGNHSTLYPSTSTLAAIIDGFCMNGRVNEALRLMDRLRREYKIDISDGNEAVHLWSTILRWSFITQRPIEGAFTDAKTFENVWTVMIKQYGIKPNDLMYRLRSRYFASKNDFNNLIADMPDILNSGNPHRLEIACLNLKRAAKGYARTGHIDEAINIVNEWAPLLGEFDQVREDVLKYINTSSMIQKLLVEGVPREVLTKSLETTDVSEENDDYEKIEHDMNSLEEEVNKHGRVNTA